MLILLKRQGRDNFDLVACKNKILLLDADQNLYKLQYRLVRVHPSIKQPLIRVVHDTVAIAELGALR
jgi:hypothetical protein